MQAKFEPSGTHVHKGFLKVRVDLYLDLEPSGCGIQRNSNGN